MIKSNFDSIIPKEERIDFEIDVNFDNNLMKISPLINDNVTNVTVNNNNNNNNDVDVDSDNNDEETNEIIEKVNLSQMCCMLQKFKIFALQRADQEFSKKTI